MWAMSLPSKRIRRYKILEREDSTVLGWVHGDTFTLTEAARNVLGPALSDVVKSYVEDDC
eukprot:5722083-Karenia_brevis.AAC.1